MCLRKYCDWTHLLYIDVTEKEVIVRQNMNGQQEFYLLLIGTMLYAYGYGAFALTKMTGSRMMLKQHEQLGVCKY